MIKTIKAFVALLALAALLAGCQGVKTPPRAVADDPNHYDMHGYMYKDGEMLAGGKIEWSSSDAQGTADIGGDGLFSLAALPSSEEVVLKVYDNGGQLVTETVYSIWPGMALKTYSDKEGRLEIDMLTATAALYVRLNCVSADTIACTYLSDESFTSGNVVVDIYEADPGYTDPNAEPGMDEDGAVG